MFAGVLDALLTPPGSLLMLAWLGWWFCKRRFGRWLLAATLSVFCLLSMSVVSNWLARTWFETIQPLPIRISSPLLTQPAPAGEQAVVILGGGSQNGALEYQEQLAFPANIAPQRLMYGLALAKQYNLPALFSGGATGGTTTSEAELAAWWAAQWGQPLQWTETASRNTAENAQLTAALLRKQQVQRIFLVTDIVHMHRALGYFACTGLQVTPAPMQFRASDPNPGLRAWLPSIKGLNHSYQMLHEAFGLIKLRMTSHGGESCPPAGKP